MILNYIKNHHNTTKLHDQVITTQRELTRSDEENKRLTQLALQGLQLLSSWNVRIMELVSRCSTSRCRLHYCSIADFVGDEFFVDIVVADIDNFSSTLGNCFIQRTLIRTETAHRMQKNMKEYD